MLRAAHLRAAFALVWLTVPIAAGAWASATSPITEQIHQIAIEDTLTGRLSPADLKSLLKEQERVDSEQGTTASYKHAMTGADDPAQFNTMRPIYIWCANEYIRSNLIAAKGQYFPGRINNPLAMQAFGDAVHALEDATSPAHEGFQRWSDSFGLITKARHIGKERVYPSSDELRRSRVLLESTVQYAYDALLGKQPIPELFFEPQHHLLVLPGDGQSTLDPHANLPPNQSQCRNICPSKACDSLSP
jgi:hypothetical protein